METLYKKISLKSDEIELIMELIGKIEDGKNDLNNWMRKYSKDYEDKVGQSLFPGSLNVRTDSVFNLYSPEFKDSVIRMDKSEYGGERHILMLPCIFKGVPAFIWRTERTENGYFGDEEKKLLEILASTKLRDQFDLKNGDEVSISIK